MQAAQCNYDAAGQSDTDGETSSGLRGGRSVTEAPGFDARRFFGSSSLLLSTSEVPAMSFLPDLVLVFPLGSEKVFNSRELELLMKAITVQNRDVEVGSQSALERLQRRGTGASLREASGALLQDLSRHLANCGCRMKTFKSCDDDELFLLVFLGDSELLAQRDQAAKEIAHAQHYRFQTKFTATNIREKLHLTQTMHSEFEAAYMEFDRDLIEQAEQKYGKFKVEGSGQEDDGDTIFQQYSEGIAGKEGSFMRTVDRIRLLTGELLGFVNLDACLSRGLIVTYYGVHNQTKLNEFCKGQPESPEHYQHGHVVWASLNIVKMLAVLRPDYTPPIQEIRNYFGGTVAFYFLWLTHTVRALIWGCLSRSLALLVYSSFTTEKKK